MINYTDNEMPYNRVIEHKHFESFGQAVCDNQKTVISREYSIEWHDGMEPFYPINDERNMQLYEQYKYYDMIPIIEKVLEIMI